MVIDDDDAMKHHLADVKMQLDEAEARVQELEVGIHETNETWDDAHQRLADALHKTGLEWGVIKSHLESPTFIKERFNLDKWIIEIKECSNCMSGIECE